MKIDILTLFPEMFEGILSTSIIKRAIANDKVEINLVNFREYTPLKNGQVDDTPYGGGAGMVLRCEPIFLALDDIKTEKSKVVLLTPDGEVYNQKKALEFSNIEHMILICGHYEGFDERIRTLVDYEISIGDYILTGGEIPAMSIIDSVVRLLDGVITKDSLESESFNNNLLDYPVYTKPQEYRGLKVPEVLINGDHAKIAQWRKEKQIEVTKLKRPDIMK